MPFIYPPRCRCYIRRGTKAKELGIQLRHEPPPPPQHAGKEEEDTGLTDDVGCVVCSPRPTTRRLSLAPDQARDCRLVVLLY